MLHGLVPFVKVLSHAQFHAIRVIIAGLGPKSHVLLMGLRVVEMRKEPFFAFCQIEGEGKRGKAKGKETQTVLESQPSGFQAQDFGPHANLIFDLDSVVIEVLEDEHSIVAFDVDVCVNFSTNRGICNNPRLSASWLFSSVQIVKNHNHLPGFVQHFRFGQQPIVKSFGASPPVKHQSR